MKRILSFLGFAYVLAFASFACMAAEATTKIAPPPAQQQGGFSVHMQDPLALNDLLGTSVGIQVHVSGTVHGIGDISGLVDLKLMAVPIEALDPDDAPPNAKTIFLKVEAPVTPITGPQVASYIKRADPVGGMFLDGLVFGAGIIMALSLCLALLWSIIELDQRFFRKAGDERNIVERAR
jgi:hypothetical protein